MLYIGTVRPIAVLLRHRLERAKQFYPATRKLMSLLPVSFQASLAQESSKALSLQAEGNASIWDESLCCVQALSP